MCTTCIMLCLRSAAKAFAYLCPSAENANPSWQGNKKLGAKRGAQGSHSRPLVGQSLKAGSLSSKQTSRQYVRDKPMPISEKARSNLHDIHYGSGQEEVECSHLRQCHCDSLHMGPAKGSCQALQLDQMFPMVMLAGQEQHLHVLGCCWHGCNLLAMEMLTPRTRFLW